MDCIATHDALGIDKISAKQVLLAQMFVMQSISGAHMKATVLISLTLLLSACGTVTPVKPIDASQWKSYNHKTDYSVRDKGENTVYLTVKYASYTFVDNSSELIPVAKSVFDHIAKEMASKKGRYAAYNSGGFYKSVAYNGITGISTALISNTVHFVTTLKTNDSKSTAKDSNILSRLKRLEKAFHEGLISQQEYHRIREEILGEL